ncbi:MAG TPA: thioredoxin family protein [Candidatus Sphingobacterium stercoripullorum]|nr:thioredoxin family protein [Candidatus Sphingobacterium stercoripullorum]
MKKTELTNEAVIQDALANSLTYAEYIEGIEKELAIEPTNEEEKMYHDYTKLNLARMNRLDRTQNISQEAQDKINAISQELYWIVITEGWCGDAAQSVPVLNKLQEQNSNIEIKIILRDENLELMDRYLTNGGRSIPKMIVYDPNAEKVLGTWGPRPTEATKLIEDYRAEHGVIDEKIREQLQVWYNKDKGNGVIEDVVNLHLSFMSL